MSRRVSNARSAGRTCSGRVLPFPPHPRRSLSRPGGPGTGESPFRTARPPAHARLRFQTLIPQPDMEPKTPTPQSRGTLDVPRFYPQALGVRAPCAFCVSSVSDGCV